MNDHGDRIARALARWRKRTARELRLVEQALRDADDTEGLPMPDVNEAPTRREGGT